MGRLILFTELTRDWAAPLLERELAGLPAEPRFFSEPLAAALDQLGPRAEEVEAVSLFLARLAPQALDRLPGLRLIATRSTGFDHLPLEETRRRGIMVCNVPAYGDNTVAEHTFALILSLSRKLRQTYDRVRREEFNLVELEGFDLRGKTLGVVGSGHIGLRVAQIARGFSMRVLVYDPRQQPLLADVLGFEYRPLEELLRGSDIVTLHAPHTPETHHLINARTLGLMRRGALLINTARGALVESEALAQALRSGHLAGAGLDVLEQESTILDEDQIRAGLRDSDTMRATVLNHILLGMESVVFTPHLAFNSREANERIFLTTAENLRAFYAGAPINVVA